MDSGRVIVTCGAPRYSIGIKTASAFDRKSKPSAAPDRYFDTL